MSVNKNDDASSVFEKTNTDIDRKSWYIGENAEGIKIIKRAMNDFYESYTKLIEVSEEIRLQNSKLMEIKNQHHQPSLYHDLPDQYEEGHPMFQDYN